MDDQNVVKRGRPKQEYPPKWLVKYARKNKLRPDIEAFKFAIETTPSNNAAARALGISPSTFYRRCEDWGVRIDR